MSQVRLKRLLSKRKEAAPIVHALLEALSAPLAIQDMEGNILLGHAYNGPQEKYPIICGNDLIGWAIGQQGRAELIAALLTHLANKEAEKDTLADEVLERYRELNLLYHLSEKLVTSLELKAVARTTLDEASRLIKAAEGCLMLLNEGQAELETIAAFGQDFQSQQIIKLGEGIIGRVALNGRAELVNDIQADARYVEGQISTSVRSLVCAPLKTKNRVLGVIALGVGETTFVAADLKLLSMLTSQSAPAIENALLHEKTLREARDREEMLQKQLLQLRLELDQVNPLLHNAFSLTPPFDFLTSSEKDWLVSRTQIFSYPSGWAISGPDSGDYDMLFLLLEGRVVIYRTEGDSRTMQGYIEAPAYFGERSVFFDQRPNARFVAESPVHCVTISGADIRALVAANSMFSQAFATALRNKQRIFYGYETFVNLLFAQVDRGLVQLRDLIEPYRELNSILHQAGSLTELDLNALAYVVPRLPEKITSALALFLAEDMPEMFQSVQEALRAPSRRAKKRDFYEVLSNKIMVLLRDRTTDTVDLITKLCIYAVETAKIRNRLFDTPLAGRLAHLAVSGNDPAEAAEILSLLPFTPAEISQLEYIFGSDLMLRLYEILAHAGDLSIYIQKADHRYAKTSPELWLSQIRHELWNVLNPQEFNDELDVHLISSNTHSVANCLSTWVNRQAEPILDWASQNNLSAPHLSLPADQLYWAARAWMQTQPARVAERAAADRENGIYIISDPSFTGIEVSLIDANRLGSDIDPNIGLPNLRRRTLIVNIDYAYGQQAELIMRSLILLFGQRIRSISVLGKSGAVLGQRGDLLLPDRLLLQTDDHLYPIPNRDLSPADFLAVGCRQPIHKGTLLTVLGPIMQSREMLYYYRYFWNAIGMEMEGSFYLREILRARSLGLIPDDVRLRFAYYTSDTPLEPHASLASSLSAAEGLPPVYAITRAMLRRILVTPEA